MNPSSSSSSRPVVAAAAASSKLLLEAIPKLRVQFLAKAAVAASTTTDGWTQQRSSSSIHSDANQKLATVVNENVHDDHEQFIKRHHQQQQNYPTFPLLTPQQETWIHSKYWKQTTTTTNASLSSSSSPVVDAANTSAAAVLVPLVQYQDEPCILFTQRASHLSRHASEISFPGGYAEPGDDTLIHTALRETMEELNVSNNNHHHHHHVGDQTSKYASSSSSQLSSSTANSSLTFPYPLDILGYATALPSKRYTPVTPVVAVCPIHIKTEQQLKEYFPGNRNEVEHVFCVSLIELLQVETTQQPKELEQQLLQPHHHQQQKLSFVSRRMLSPLPPPIFVTQQYGTIWGLTAFILQPLLHGLFQPVLLPDWKKKNNDNYDNRDPSSTGEL